MPVAGYGTRFLPVTKTQPKEMLPVLNKPVIHYLVEEAVASGIEEIIIVTGRGKRAIEDYFDHSFELEHNLVEKGKHELLKEVQAISKLAKFTYVRQPVPRGCGDAILQAMHLVQNEPVAVLFGDDLVFSDTPALSQLLEVYEQTQGSVIALTELSQDMLGQYGVVDLAQPFDPKQHYAPLKGLVEKPAEPSLAPSNFGVIGKYVLSPQIPGLLDEMSALHNFQNGELRLANVLMEAISRGQQVYGKQIQGERFDAGSVEGLLRASLAVARAQGIQI